MAVFAPTSCFYDLGHIRLGIDHERRPNNAVKGE